MSTYSEKLKDPRWQKKRLEILERDEWKCQECDDTKNTLNIHHRYYLKDTEPWDYDNTALITLCNDCHEEASQYDSIHKEQLIRYVFDIFNDSEVVDIAYGFHELLNYKHRYGEELPCDISLLTKVIENSISNKDLLKKMVDNFIAHESEND